MMNTETWSYTIMGNNTGSRFYGTYIDIIIASLTFEEYKDWPNQLHNDDYIRILIDRCYDTFISNAFKTEFRLAFQVLGAFIMEYGGKITEKLKKIILKFSKWNDERGQLIKNLDRCERKKYLLNFRAELLKYKNGDRVKIPDETVTDVVNKRKLENDIIPIWRQSINYKIGNIKEEVERYYNINTTFKINNFITVRLEGTKTVIYVNNEEFIDCKYLLYNLPIEKENSFGDIESIDELEEKIQPYLDINNDTHIYVPFDLEFWGHCSSLQVWAENNYDTRLIHSNLAFPLLKKLTELGDSMAKKVFKKEIVKRFETKHISVMKFLLSEDYLKYLDINELQYLIDSLEILIQKTKDIKESQLLQKIKNKVKKTYIKS